MGRVKQQGHDIYQYSFDLVEFKRLGSRVTIGQVIQQKSRGGVYTYEVLADMAQRAAGHVQQLLERTAHIRRVRARSVGVQDVPQAIPPLDLVASAIPSACSVLAPEEAELLTGETFVCELSVLAAS